MIKLYSSIFKKNMMEIEEIQLEPQEPEEKTQEMAPDIQE